MKMKMNELTSSSIGLYLYLLVVETFSRIEVINKFVIYAVIGYGKCWESYRETFAIQAARSDIELSHEIPLRLHRDYFRLS